MVYHNLKALIKGIRSCKAPRPFGQIECLKLVASPRFSDKRLGYLGIMLLLDENQDTINAHLQWLINPPISDMNHSNMYAVGLAYPAALCALRVVKKVPDIADHFTLKAKNLLTDRNHGVLLTAITLVTEMCQIDAALLEEFRSAVPLLVRNLKSLILPPSENLRLLRLLGKGDEQASETMNDILAQVATNTDSSKNVGNSISDTGLRVMAINILGKFLSNKDKTFGIYVALNTLNKVNVRILIRELLAFLELGLTTQISLAAERFAPNKRWHIDTVLRVLKLAGNFVREEILSAFIQSLTLAATWILGEYSEIIVQGGVVDDEQTIPFVLAALTKIAARSTTSVPEQDRIAEVLATYTNSPELELQQRAVEFASLFTLGETRIGVLEQMPPPELKSTGDGVSEKKPVGSTKGGEIDFIGEDVPSTPATANIPPAASAQSNQDLLAEIFGGMSMTNTSPPPAAAPQRSAVDSIMGLFDTPNVSSPGLPTPHPSAMPPAYSAAPASARAPTQAMSPPAPAQQRLTAYPAYDKNDLKITLTPQTSPTKPGIVMILARFQVSGNQAATGLSFQAAVPKSQQLQMLPMSNPNINPGAVETQQMRVVAPVGTNVRLRLRIAYSIAGQNVQEQVDFAGFPPASQAPLHDQ
ncbi:hypothetical protein BJ912DRAFT_945106 [Pholiota molesta]|nr:hypothetical protein BJ912DRAFT_945106 [Pholiota molesta]